MYSMKNFVKNNFHTDDFSIMKCINKMTVMKKFVDGKNMKYYTLIYFSH